jgi:hypothetical protein
VPTITEQVIQQLSNGGLARLGQTLGTDQQTAIKALSAAAPLLVTALARNAAQPAGAQDLHKALADDHDGSILNNLASLLNDPGAGAGAGILRHVLGSQRAPVEHGLAQDAGVSTSAMSGLLELAAPVVLGMLGQQQRQQGLDPSGLAQLVGSAAQAEQSANPGLAQTVTGLLDANHDGGVMDELGGIAGKLFKRKKH